MEMVTAREAEAIMDQSLMQLMAQAEAEAEVIITDMETMVQTPQRRKAVLAAHTEVVVEVGGVEDREAQEALGLSSSDLLRPTLHRLRLHHQAPRPLLHHHLPHLTPDRPT